MKRMPIVSLFATLVFFSSHPAEAQKSAKVARIGFLTPESRTSGRFEAFRQGFAISAMWRERISSLSTEARKMDPGESS